MRYKIHKKDHLNYRINNYTFNNVWKKVFNTISLGGMYDMFRINFVCKYKNSFLEDVIISDPFSVSLRPLINQLRD